MALQDAFGVTAAFLGGSIRDTAKGYPQTRAAVLGPWAYNVGVMNLVSFSFIPASLLSPGTLFQTKALSE